MRKFIFSIILIFIFLYSHNAYAASNYGTWAEGAISNAISHNIVDYNPDRNYYSPITRHEIAEIIANAYSNLKGKYVSSEESPFFDTDDQKICMVSELGIMNGYGDGTFLPNATTSRQEMAKILLTYRAILTDKPINYSSKNYCEFVDYENLSEWAKPYVVTAVSEGLLNGYEDGSFGGLKPVSWQEAIVMVERVAKFVDNNIISQDFNLKIALSDNVANISWSEISDDTHTITITEQRLSRYEGDIPPNKPVILNFNDETNYTFEVNPNKQYTIKISCGNYYCEKDIYTNRIYYEDMDEIYSSYPTSKEEAEPLMVEITVPVWRLNGSTKSASTATFKVHYAIAEKVKLVFEEIFNGEEKFPIKDVGGYSWRGGRSEHNGGTAIDINSNENYCIYNNGTTVGSYWKPYEDPYSILPYGDVIRAFEKYGFTWGGDSWSNPKDYMHFSYLGT